MSAFTKQTCADCHFFYKEARTADGTFPSEITREEREKARKEDYSWQSKSYALSCHMKVWDEGHNFDKSRKHQIITQDNRRNFCFFWHHHPGMLFHAAQMLQQRQAEAREARRDRKLTIYGLWLAGCALAANVWLQLAERLNWWPF